jgi:protocatechuate 3,4-dioxygenase beta subunit
MVELIRPSRRHLLYTGAIATGGLGLARFAFAQGRELPATPACGGEATLRQTEGPFYKPRSPERADLIEPGMSGRVVEVTGLVLTRSCRPVSGAVGDRWQADDEGSYDNRGFRLRGHQFTDAQGRYRFRTILPGGYTGRTRHLHVKVAAPDRSPLTTQLYFPDEPGNRRDPLFRRELLMQIAPAQERLAARFDFVLDIG